MQNQSNNNSALRKRPSDKITSQMDKLPTKRKRKQPLSACIAGDHETDQEIEPLCRLRIVHKRVPKATIDSKWSPLSTPALDKVSQLLENAERSVVMAVQNDRKRSQARVAIQSVSHKLHRKLSKGLPFPSAIRKLRENDFDFENVLNNSRSLEGQLTTTLHSIELLKAQVKKEEMLLMTEKSECEELESNAQREADRTRVEARKFHPLLQVGVKPIEYKGVEMFFKRTANTGSVAPIEVRIPGQFCASTNHLQRIDTYSELKPLLTQIHGHVDSIQANSAQIEELENAILSGKAGLQDVLFRYVDSVRYNRTILG